MGEQGGASERPIRAFSNSQATRPPGDPARFGREIKMGVDIRDIPADAAAALPEQFREAGFDVELIVAPDPQDRGIMVTQAICRRRGDEQRLSWGWKAGKPGDCRIAIANAHGWRRSVRERRDLMQKEITVIIERAGGYWPFPD